MACGLFQRPTEYIFHTPRQELELPFQFARTWPPSVSCIALERNDFGLQELSG